MVEADSATITTLNEAFIILEDITPVMGMVLTTHMDNFRFDNKRIWNLHDNLATT